MHNKPKGGVVQLMVKKGRNSEPAPGTSQQNFKYEVAQEMGLSGRTLRRQIKKQQKD